MHPPRPRSSFRSPRYPRILGIAAGVASLIGCGGPPKIVNSGGVVAAPFHSAATATPPEPTQAAPASSSPPEAIPDGDIAPPYESK